IPAIKLNTSHAYHSKMMDRAAVEFEEVFKNIKPDKPTKKFISNLTGEIAKEEVTTPGYWSQQLRNTVQFATGVTTLRKLYNHQITFIEVGPSKGLTHFVNSHKNTNQSKSLLSLQLLPSAKEAGTTTDNQNNESSDGILAKLWMKGIIHKANKAELIRHGKLT